MTFRQREAFWAEHGDAIRAASRLDSIFSRCERFFGDYTWIAAVTVPPCDASISAARAIAIVKRCLDFLKFWVGSGRTSRIHQAYDVAHPECLSRLKQSEGIFGVSISHHGGDAILNDEWFDQLSQNPIWHACDAAIRSYWSNWDRGSDEIHQRLMDAVAWHADAISDTDVTSRIVKYWTAIERVTSFKANDPVTRRAAALASRQPADFKQQFRRVQTLYGKRSDIIHGSTFRGDLKLKVVAADCEMLSQTVIFALLGLIHRWPQNRDGEIAKSLLVKYFQRLDSESKHVERQ